MNTKKHKNKNKPKPANPNPPQTENVPSEETKQVEEKAETDIVLKPDERVPEIISEVINQPIADKPPPNEGDTPKKPKRNRGKKKSGKDNENEDSKDEIKTNPDEPIQAQVSEPQVEIEPSKIETKDETFVEIVTENIESSTMTPVARKKKNKNKKHGEPDNQTKQDVKEDFKEIVPIPIKEEEKTENRSKLETVDTKQDIEATKDIEHTESESKSSKKKNKKKKRNDSERSEEAIAVTAAFQKLMVVTDENKSKESTNIDEVKPILTENIIPLDISAKDTDCAVSESVAPDVFKEATAEDSKVKLVESDKEDTSKGKKKNKKDKKHPPKHEIETELHKKVESESIDKSIPKESEGAKEIVKSEPHTKIDIVSYEVVKPTELSDIDIESDKKIKGKAKIAKPVDKKHKENVESLREPVLETVTTEQEKKIEEIKPQTKLEEDVNIIPREESTENLPELEKIEVKNVVTETESGVANKTENITVPDNKTNKKGKKSPKPPKRKDITDDNDKVDVLPEEEKVTDISALEIPQQSIKIESLVNITDRESTSKPQNIDVEEFKEAHPLEANTSASVCEIPVQQSSSTSAEIQQEPTLKDYEPILEKSEDICALPTAMGKKRKKSPRPPKTLVTGENKEVTKTDLVSDRPEEPINKGSGNPETSTKTEESEISTCNIVPDVQHPRASSYVDDNNNVIIQEIAAEAATLLIPLDIPETPFIKGSGETPLKSPDFISSGVKIVEIDTEKIKSGEEKTDLKSKVLEVNKDMEELRLSIERSLAELTAIEKSEQEIDKPFQVIHEKPEPTTKTTPIEEAKLEEHEKVEIKDEIETVTEKSVEKSISTKGQDTLDTIVPLTVQEILAKDQGDDKTKPQKEQSVEISESVLFPKTETPPPIQPPRRENKGKGKKKKGKQDVEHTASAATTSASSTTQSSSSGNTDNNSKDTKEDPKKEEKGNEKSDNTQENGKQQSMTTASDDTETDSNSMFDITQANFEPIDTFEDALTSSGDADDVNRNFEILANDNNRIEMQTEAPSKDQNKNNPEINITAPIEDDEKKDRQERVNPVSQPKNLIGHPDIPARLSRADYKKEKNKTPNAMQAKVKIKDDVPVEQNKQSKESQTDSKDRFMKDRKSANETITCMTHENEEYVYKYSFRKVFLPNACHVCKKELKQSRVACTFCNLIFYCSPKHKDEDNQKHQPLCFAVSTIAHLKDQKHIYAEAKNVTGHAYRLLRMQAIISCERVLKRKLVPWEQEALLYPRMCVDPICREWKQPRLKDCDGCGQISYCADYQDHLSQSHQRWCKSYLLYQKLVTHQQMVGRVEPRLPTRVMADHQMSDKMNEVLASMYEEKIDMSDIQYAALTQACTAPLTAAYALRSYAPGLDMCNGLKKSLTIHIIGAELQFEADSLNKWELFFLHLRPDVRDLRVVLLGPELNPSQLPLDLLGKMRPCDSCQQNKRRVIFDFQDKKSYYEYWSTDFITPDLVCAFNPSIQRCSVYNGKDTWPATIKCVTKLRVPFIITAYTMTELQRDLARVKQCSDVDVNVISEPKINAYASVRPDRNFISDDETPLLFKNQCYAVICGTV